MSGTDEKFRFSLKAMLNRDESKVLFVEADNHFVDVLLSFLTMPLGKILRLLHKHYGDKLPAIGSLNSLYKGLQNLGSVHFSTESGKEMLLNPRNSSEAECRRLKLNVDDEPTKYFVCDACFLLEATMKDNQDECPECDEGKYVEVPFSVQESNDTGVFTTMTGTSIIFDDLRILPVLSGFVSCFGEIGITEMEGAKIRKVSFGFNEIMDLLKGLFISKTPLTDIILKDRCSAAANSKSHILLTPVVCKPVSGSKKMRLKVMVQKSTNKVLFGEAGEDLVEFLFSFLAVPLGGVASLLQGNTSLTNIDNLYKNIADSTVVDKHLLKPAMKNRLLKPKVGLHHLSSNQILPLDEETLPPLYYRRGADGKKYLSPESKAGGSKVYTLESPIADGYVTGPRTYMITDDLVITQLSMEPCFSIVCRLNIPMSDVKHLNFYIGVPEGLRILKASLTSNSALTDALLKPMEKKEPKQEN